MQPYPASPKITWVDPSTGVIHDAYVAKRRNTNGFHDEGWSAMSTKLHKLLMQAKPSYKARLVLDYLLAEVRQNNDISHVSQASAARDLHIRPNSAGDGFAELADLRIIEKVGKNGRATVWWLAPEYTWKGPARAHREILKARALANEQRRHTNSANNVHELRK